MEDTAKACQAKHAAQKARKEVEAKAREETKKRKIAEEKKKKKTLDYLQQLWDEVLAENATLLEGTRCSQVMGTKCRKTISENKKK